MRIKRTPAKKYTLPKKNTVGHKNFLQKSFFIRTIPSVGEFHPVRTQNASSQTILPVGNLTLPQRFDSGQRL